MDIRSYSFVVVGSGLFGSVIAERIANELDQAVLLIEKRDHIGGNCFSVRDNTTDIEYHPYGTHIFHTSNEKVWKYISEFITFNTYRHQVLSHFQDKVYQLPINLETINSFYGVNLKPFEVDDFLASKTTFYATPANFEEKALATIGKDLYEAFIKGYTVKHWKIDPKELPQEIFDRIPIRKNYDENYFFDKWQGIPEQGYGVLFQRLLQNDKIEVLLNTDFFDLRERLNADAHLVYSGPIDQFFNYKYGQLSWRSLRFEKEILPYEDYQGNAVINYPELHIPFTRIHEPRHLHPERKYSSAKTLIQKEYSIHSDGKDPFYPIATTHNNHIYNQYKAEAELLEKVYIGGRLGDYKYFDMHQTIAKALEIFETKIAPRFLSTE